MTMGSAEVLRKRPGQTAVAALACPPIGGHRILQAVG
ncbi:hypothetical protein LAUMK13_04961 [Mycobacterium innocens]|uniref:Uncharacterized protein n=1 Tax=Mycobacterium innocens TaxID=2341083 RepID=A0A498QLB0_9MYCO|nr:hypothetical protein LAUMK13_04961 [Mycobacterium innocens]